MVPLLDPKTMTPAWVSIAFSIIPISSIRNKMSKRRRQAQSLRRNNQWNRPLQTQPKVTFDRVRNLNFLHRKILWNQRFQRIFGPSDRVRTCGLMVPNHPRYQLRYTRIFDFRFLKISLYVVIPWSKAFVRRFSGGGKSPQTETLRGFPASTRDAARIPALRSEPPALPATLYPDFQQCILPSTGGPHWNSAANRWYYIRSGWKKQAWHAICAERRVCRKMKVFVAGIP